MSKTLRERLADLHAERVAAWDPAVLAHTEAEPILAAVRALTLAPVA